MRVESTGMHEGGDMRVFANGRFGEQSDEVKVSAGLTESPV
jgi:hypothetical protein